MACRFHALLLKFEKRYSVSFGAYTFLIDSIQSDYSLLLVADAKARQPENFASRGRL